MLWFSWWKPSGHPRLSGCHPSYGGTRVGNNNQEWAKQGSSRLWDKVRCPIRKCSKDPGLHIPCWQADFLYMFTECCIRACSNIKITYMFLDVNDIATGAGVVCRRFQGGVITLSKIFKLKIIEWHVIVLSPLIDDLEISLQGTGVVYTWDFHPYSGSHTSHRRIFKPDFQEKFIWAWNGPIWAKKGPKRVSNLY